jgi:hypothetical protein
MGINNSTLNNNLIKYKYLSGPVSLYYLKKNDKQIFLFGDEHSQLEYGCTQKKSINLIEFLDLIFLNSDKKIDFLVESRYYYIEPKAKIEGEQDLYITNLIHYYIKKGCFLRDKKKCSENYPNTRFHSVDYRFSNLCKSMKYIWDNMNKLLDLSYDLDYSDKKFLIFRKFEKIMKNMKNMNTYDKLEKLINKSFNCKKLKEQIDNCDISIKNKILKYKRDVMIENNKLYKKKYNDTINKFNKMYLQKDKLFNYSFAGIYADELCNIIIYATVVIMDIYCLARLFKKFKNNDEQNMMKNVIIYAGAFHIENYLLFLTKYMNYKLELGTKATKKRCMDISKLPKLLFKNVL